mmetsp:Transcript_35028/g.80989  ORF Transcript_35028/g.80989 Transcript_35028/m.80989 type:complete len:264 (-) Transcript_35028:524-1315(-)
MIFQEESQKNQRHYAETREMNRPPIYSRPHKRDSYVSSLIYESELKTLYHPEKSRVTARGADDVEYKDHPWSRRRKLQKADSFVIGDGFSPIRIHFDTKEIQLQNALHPYDESSFIISYILPRLAKQFATALQIIPVSNFLKIDPTRLQVHPKDGTKRCGHKFFGYVPDNHIKTGIYETDVIVYVSGSYGYIGNERDVFCDDTTNTLAVGMSCNTDQFDRPTAGSIHFCLEKIRRRLQFTDHREDTKNYILDVSIHGMYHMKS